MRLGYTLCLALILVPLTLYGQAPRVISYQGFLTDTLGAPVPDASRSMTFTLYDSDVGPTALWTETQSVASVGGIFNVVLGSVNPISGVDLDQEIWLGVEVETDGEMTPRTKVASAPTALGLATPLQDTLRIVTSDLGTDGSEGVNEDLTIHANDAMVGLYSNEGGGAGSGFQLGEILGGALTSKWSIYRQTLGAGGRLQFSYGQNPNYVINPTRVSFDTSGVVTATDFAYSVPDTGYASLAGNAMTPLYIDANTVWYGSYFTAHTTAYDWVHGPIQIPQGAIVEQFGCTVYDADADDNLRCLLCVNASDGYSCDSYISLVESSGSSGTQEAVQNIYSADPVDNRHDSYVVRVFPVNNDWSAAGANLRILRAWVKYTMPGPR